MSLSPRLLFWMIFFSFSLFPTHYCLSLPFISSRHNKQKHTEYLQPRQDVPNTVVECSTSGMVSIVKAIAAKGEWCDLSRPLSSVDPAYTNVVALDNTAANLFFTNRDPNVSVANYTCQGVAACLQAYLDGAKCTINGVRWVRGYVEVEDCNAKYDGVGAYHQPTDSAGNAVGAIEIAPVGQHVNFGFPTFP